MKQTIDLYDFHRAFNVMGRDDPFTYEGLSALFDWLIEIEEGTGEEMELDVVGICCEFTEYESLEELQQSYPEIRSLDDLAEETGFVIAENDHLIVQDY
tara:strand:+ start:498 stop:794 length:297 start_codon:yes stop_codon:yes gene_type:complete